MTRKMIEALNQGAKHQQSDESSAMDIRMIPAGILAYLGDSTFEIIVRNYFIRQGFWDSHKLHKQVIKFVRAEGQANLLREITDQLTEEEQSVLRRGRNSNAGNVPKNANVTDYRYSTALEAVLGYLMLKGDHERLEIVIGLIEEYLARMTGK